MEAWFGLPEESGDFPFVLRFVQGSYTFLALGLSGQTPRILEDMGTFEPQKNQLVALQATIAAHFLFRAFEGHQSEEWDILSSLLPRAEDFPPLPTLDPQYARTTKLLRHPQLGAYMAFAPEQLQEAMAALTLAIKNPHAQKELIDATVDTLANMALTLPKRRKWQLALEEIALLARIQMNDEVAQLALQNAAGIAQGKEGSMIPFVRDWAEQALQSAVALARMVEKANQLPKESS